ncbi:MAG: hypothetical protein CM15mP44_5320 [Candidatus Neomarinimicrobiota bacterium]|nr:MAG: hypothetical protein CM15mP44_5320 [Candidatus Neomarinimicrobiota bacterium]
MKSLPNSAKKLIQEFSNLPGIGRKTAQRLTFYILQIEKKVSNLSQALLEIKEKIHNCIVCNGITEEETCSICTDSNRDSNIICVVEHSHDIIVFEKNQWIQWKISCFGWDFVSARWCWTRGFKYTKFV